MKNYLSGKMLRAKWKMMDYMREFAKNEEGDTNFVSIMLIIVIVIALAILFRDTLTEVAENVLGQLTDFVG